MDFSSSRVYYYNPKLIPAVAAEVAAALESEYYTVKYETTICDDADISISKGGIFKAILGMKTALKVYIYQQDGHIKAEAKVGIFGQQAIPTVISMLFFWPVLITQIWGIIKQSKLDDHVLDLIGKSLERLSKTSNLVTGKTCGQYCPECGENTCGGKFCPECGAKL